MKAWFLPADEKTAAGLELREVPMPDPGLGQVRIRTAALSINARDLMILRGPFGRAPGQELTPLSDVAGTIDAVGEGVDGWQVGDRVMTAHAPGWQDGPAREFGIGAGSLDDPGVATEEFVVDSARLVATPDGLSDAEAATLQVAGVTAWNSVFGEHPLPVDGRILVIGSGGVSLYAAQIAKAIGAEVFAALRKEADASLPGWESIGLAGHVTTEREGWGNEVYERFGGVDKVVDILGPGAAPETLAALRGSGESAVPGLIDMTPPTIDLMTMIGRGTSLRGVAVGSVAMHRDLAAFLVRHGVHPIIDRHVAFEELPAAYAAMSDGGVFGKVVIDVAKGR